LHIIREVQMLSRRLYKRTYVRVPNGVSGARSANGRAMMSGESCNKAAG